jgi:hypothetical protein
MTDVRVDVRDVHGQPLPKARVRLRPRDKGKQVALRWSKDGARHIAADVAPGEYVAQVSAAGLREEEREVTVDPGGSEELFILGKEGAPTYFRGKVRVPVDADPELVAIYVAPGTAKDPDEELRDLASELKVSPERLPEPAERYGVRLFRVPRDAQADVLKRLREHRLVQHAGAVVGRHEEGVSFLTDELVVKLRDATAEGVRRLAEEHGLELARSELPYSPGTFVLRTAEPPTLDLLATVEKIAGRADVEWAEPNLVTTPALDAVTPTDILWDGLYDRQLIDLPDAWQRLQDAGLQAFGEADVVIAIMDSGTQSSGGAPTNPDLQGTVSDGTAKVVAAFDFGAMVANNDAPWDTHGSGVAGVVTARANNPSPVAGQNAGLAGSAPNCRVITMQSGGDEVRLCDAFIWAAGFNPQSPLPTFPAPPVLGADVTTCSLGLGAGAALSGTAQAMLDFMTTFGRGGKGCLCFFSTGNGNSDNTINRPYSAYEKAFGIAATTLDDTMTNEIRAPYSGHGKIALCAPSHDQFPVLHNPPARLATWGLEHLNNGNMIGWRAIETTLSAASAAGATTLTVASAAGLAAMQVIHVGAIGANGSEPARITAVNAATNTLTVQGWMGTAWGGGLINAHGVGNPVAQGPAHWTNSFGGTSSATPLTAGVAALVLSAEPDLTWVEAREVMRDAAVKFDVANNDPVGRWLDAAGNPSATSGQPPVRSGWYGYGRVDADGAVQGAVDWMPTRDIVVRDNLSDTGAVASTGAFWNSPDIWVRNLTPMSDPGALPPNYGTAGPHQDTIRGQDNWVYVRVRNNGSEPSLDAWVRVSITHYPGTEFTYPASWRPSTRPGVSPVSPLTTGTYLIGEVKISALAAGADQTINVRWPAAIIPPATVMVGAATVTWHPCLLVEVTPHDGPDPTGNHVWDDNNLAQKNITIVNADAGGDFASAIVVGAEDVVDDGMILEVIRGRLPAEVQLYVNLVDPALLKRLRRLERRPPRAPLPAGRGAEPELTAGAVAALTRVRPGRGALLSARPNWRIGQVDGQDVVLLRARPKVRIPIATRGGALVPLVVGGVVGKRARAGTYTITVLQRSAAGEIRGSAQVGLVVGKQE